ncbi:MAG: hypothetical protein LRY61_11935 [Burkholderiaceae bacterium]|nr:hypothetical protein [Burkholderiaceae bacterium]
MDLDQRLAQFQDVPVGHDTVVSLLRDYKRPNDKISAWLAEKKLIPIKRGLYVVSPALTGGVISLPLVANALYGPSYVSLEFALSHHGLIPEAVHQVTSVTIRRGKTYDTVLGRFSYQTLPRKVYPIGVQSVKTDMGHFHLMASPEKALCDMLMLTPNLSVHSVGSLKSLFELDWRIDLDMVMKFDRALVRQIAHAGYKARALGYLLQLIDG